MSGTHAIGIDLGGTKILAGVVTRDGEVLRRHERMTSLESQEALVAELETAIAEVVADDVGAIGLGVPGPLDLDHGRTYDMVNLPFHDFPLRDHMARRFGLPVGIDNDANAATRRAQEAFGPAADAHRLVRLANEGEATAREILVDIGRHLGSGMGSFANIFEPALIVIGGGFGVAAWDHLIGPAEEVMRREALRPMRDEVKVVRAELGTTAGLIGAAFVAFEALDAA